MSRLSKETKTIDPVEGLAALADLRALTSQLAKHEEGIAKSQGIAEIGRD